MFLGIELVTNRETLEPAAKQATYIVERMKEYDVQISIDGVVFEGSNQRTVLEQAEAAGLSISNNCRAGFCGACKVSSCNTGAAHW